jgi:hypothetical protein
MTPSIEQGLWTYLKGSITDLRLYPDRLPQQPDLPAAIYQRISTAPSYTHDGDTCTDDVRIQISAFGVRRIDADGLLDKIREKLSGFSGDMGGVKVGRVFLRNQVASFEPDVDYYVSRQDYIIGQG